MKELVEAAYRMFEADRPRGRLCVCHCPVCMDEATMRALVATPLRGIPSTLLAEYTNSAHGWDETVEREFRYYLPRYLELIATGDPPCSMGLPSCLRRLAEAGWQEHWNRSERDLLDAFFRDLLALHLGEAEVGRSHVGWMPLREIEDTLTLAITAGASLEPLLASWWIDPRVEACVHLAGLRMGLRPAREGWRPSSAFLDRHPGPASAIGAFAMQRGWRARMEAAFFTLEHAGQQQLVSDALALWP